MTTTIGYAVAWLDDSYNPPVWRIIRDTCTYTPMSREQAEDYAGTLLPEVRVATITIPDEEADR